MTAELGTGFVIGMLFATCATALAQAFGGALPRILIAAGAIAIAVTVATPGAGHRLASLIDQAWSY